MDYRVRYYAGTLSKTHAKAGQRNAEILEHKTVLSTIQNDLLHGYVVKAIVSSWNTFRSCVAASGGHSH